MIRTLDRTCTACGWTGRTDVDSDGWWQCPQCDGSWIPQHPPPDVGGINPGAAQIGTIARACGVPGNLVQLIQSPRVQPWPAILAAERAEDGGVGVLVLSGDAGTGKSTGAAGTILVRAGRCVSGDDRPACWLAAVDLAQAYTFEQTDRAKIASIRQRIQGARLLVLDGLGKEPVKVGGAWELSLGQLLDTRAERHARTIITTRLGGDALARRYPAAAYQMLDADRCRLVPLQRGSDD